METTNKNTVSYVGLGAFVVISFFLGYLLYPQINNKTDMNMDSMHKMPDGKMMMDKNSTKSMDQMMMDMNSSLTGKSGDEFDAAFLKEMITHHIGAVDMAKMVLTSSKRPELIKFANEIILAQEKEVSSMRGWQKSWFGIQAQ